MSQISLLSLSMDDRPGPGSQSFPCNLKNKLHSYFAMENTFPGNLNTLT